jgi:hypothetical protein
MGRKILAVIVAMITAVAIIWVGWMISTMIAPNTPKNLEYSSANEIAEYARTLPTSSYIAALVGYILAAFAGGFVVTKMSRRESPGPSLPVLVGILLTFGGFFNYLFVWKTQPLWFIIVSLVVFIPISLLGHRLAR